ncbi:oligosaccharide flippase family protein [Aurantimonas sp. A3-2-R12]|uniref:oligosaccharide flippase family protein n=1 Tax=Aurantimonas sp. A3-2-R12 TaxID=3114362 RepID=UPI002E199769|nr:oligosaccharide flippase family protein [Aurantimonas sp. A3-2-R12]
MSAVFSVSLLTIAAIVNAVLAFGTQLLLVRLFAPQDYGIFAAAFATVVLLVPLAGFGIAPFWLKIFSENPTIGRRYLKSSYALMALMSITVFVLLFGWSYLQPQDSEMRPMLQILSICILGQLTIELLNTKFQLEKKILQLALISLTQNGLRLGLIGLFVLVLENDISLYHVAISYAASALMIILLGLFTFRNFVGSHRWIGFPNTANPPVRISQVAKGSLPFGVALFFQLVYYQSDVVMLKLLSTPAQTGYYSIAFTLVAATYILPTVIFQKFFLPKIYIWANLDPARLRRFSVKAGIGIGVAGLLVAAIYWVASDMSVAFLFGERYAASASVLRVLSLSIPAIFVSYNFGAILMTRDSMKTKTYFMGIVALFNILANLFMIPEFGAQGAAVTTLMSAVLLLMLYFVGARKAVEKIVNISVQSGT